MGKLNANSFTLVGMHPYVQKTLQINPVSCGQKGKFNYRVWGEIKQTDSTFSLSLFQSGFKTTEKEHTWSNFTSSRNCFYMYEAQYSEFSQLTN